MKKTVSFFIIILLVLSLFQFSCTRGLDLNELTDDYLHGQWNVLSITYVKPNEHYRLKSPVVSGQIYFGTDKYDLELKLGSETLTETGTFSYAANKVWCTCNGNESFVGFIKGDELSLSHRFGKDIKDSSMSITFVKISCYSR